MNYPSPTCLHQLFEGQVERTPQAIALRQSDINLTYQAVNQRANQLAHHLQALGVGGSLGAECLVGLYLERSLETLIGLLAILKAGGAYVPLDPAYPAARLAFMVEDAQLAFVVTRTGLVEQLPALTVGIRPHLICLDRVQDELHHLPTTNPLSQTTGDNLAYVIYTSGSTGQPKGVLGLHRGMVNVLAWLGQRYPFSATDVGCQKTSLNFVDSIWEIFWPLSYGAPLVILPDAVVKDMLQFIQALNYYGVTRLVVVPSLLGALLEVTALQHHLPCLNFWVTSGEALSVKLCTRFYEQMPQAILLNLYGSSEVSANASWYDTREFDAQLPSIPIGRPLANTTLFILDDERNPVPMGVVGELYVGGAGLARGYLNQPDLTQKQFIPYQFGGSCRVEWLYKTGDQARFVLNRAGEPLVEFMGRLDQQVKIRGMRVELPEIEKTLLQHPDVRECVVMVNENSAGQQQMIAYVVAYVAEPWSAQARHFRHFLQARLPDYMIPGDFIRLDALPLTPNGKVNRLVLATLPRQSAVPKVAPRTTTEEVVGGIWQEVLGLAQVDIHESFFESGGDSLSLLRLQTKIAQTFAVKPSLLELLRFPTVAMQAAYLTGDLTGGAREALVDLEIVALQAADLDKTIQCLIDSFVHGEILAQTMQMTHADFLPFAQKVCGQAVADGVSLIAKDKKTGEVVGFSICEDFMAPADETFDDFAQNQKPILAFLAEMDAQYKENHPELKMGDLLHILLGGSNQHYRGVGGLLQKATLTLAQARGYRGVISNDTGKLAQAVSALDGFTEVLALPYHPFTYQNTTPFRHLPDDLHCKLMLKTFGSTE